MYELLTLTIVGLLIYNEPVRKKTEYGEIARCIEGGA
jgi:hypothetical protein